MQPNTFVHSCIKTAFCFDNTIFSVWEKKQQSVVLFFEMMISINFRATTRFCYIELKRICSEKNVLSLECIFRTFEVTFIFPRIRWEKKDKNYFLICILWNKSLICEFLRSLKWIVVSNKCNLELNEKECRFKLFSVIKTKCELKRKKWFWCMNHFSYKNILHHQR